MIVPDANLLLYTYNSTSPFHSKSAQWWTQCLTGREEVGLCPAVLFAFLRISTGARILRLPLSLEEAFDHIDSWLNQPNVLVLSMEPTDVTEAMGLLKSAGTGGNLATDAQIAATARRLGGVVHTADSDFSRFDGIRWYNPITGRSGR